ncbi:tyrosine-type recombinase/integrase [Achromobacter piechaudii]|nr:Arm DNA-binding domain-containing protein [Achromobacter piechaudii]
MPLTDTAVRQAKPTEKPRKLSDSGGLYLLVNKAGRYWRWKYRHGGKEKVMALGVYPDVSLAQARERHQEGRKLLASGVDPMADRKQQASAPAATTFEQAARQWWVHWSPSRSARHAEYVLRRLEADVFPEIGGIQTTRVAWGEKVEGSARDILGAVEAPQTEETSEEEDAVMFLRDLLADGPVPSKQVKADADGAGFAWATVRRAQKRIGAEAVKEGGRLGDRKQQWVWRLGPNPEGAQEIQKMLTPKREHLLENLSTFKENPSTEAEAGQATKDEEF